MKVLIVDDSVADVELIKSSLILQSPNDLVHACNSVTLGLKAIDNQAFDVVLLDCHMPEMDGIEMVLELRSRVHLGNTAIVMVSSSESEQLAINCLEAGAQDFLAKSELSTNKLSRAIIHARKRFELEQELHASYTAAKKMAERDALTGLSNRHHFEESLKVMLANNRRSAHQVALLVLDLDNFKHVNDSLGHDAGDQLLIMAVDRVSACLRKNEGFARLGGDEFAIILGGIDSIGQVSTFADRVLSAFAEPFELGGTSVTCGVSIGIALFPADASSATELAKSADIAMYRAKQNGRNKVCFYETDMQVQFNKRFAIQNGIQHVLKSSGFQLHYQPVFDVQSRSVLGFEALIRWPMGGDKVYSPDEFIPVAEETGLIHSVGRWVIEQAVIQLAKWKSKYAQKLSMSINISPVQLLDNNTVRFLIEVVKKAKLEPNDIVLEITETAFFKDSKKIKEALQNLSAHGFLIALDDFGTGFSSIAHLMDYPIDIVKLDKSMFVEDSSKRNRSKILQSLAIMLQNLSFVVVAEGIETEANFLICTDNNINRAQGYLLSKPIAVDAIETDIMLKE